MYTRNGSTITVKGWPTAGHGHTVCIRRRSGRDRRLLYEHGLDSFILGLTIGHERNVRTMMMPRPLCVTYVLCCSLDTHFSIAMPFRPSQLQQLLRSPFIAVAGLPASMRDLGPFIASNHPFLRLSHSISLNCRFWLPRSSQSCKGFGHLISRIHRFLLPNSSR